MHIVTTQVVKHDGDVVGNWVELSMSGSSVFPSVVAVIPYFFEVFQTDVALPHFNELSLLFQHQKFPLAFEEHMVESLGFLLVVIAKDFHAIIVLIEPQQIPSLSICKRGACTKSRGNVAVDFSHVGSFRIEVSLIL